MQYGYLAEKFGYAKLPIQVLKSHAGYYIGTLDFGMPNSRESQEYFATRDEAEAALESGNWTQRLTP